MIVTTAEFMALEGYITYAYDALFVCSTNLQSGLSLIVASSDPYVEADMLDPWFSNMTDAEDSTTDLLFQATQSLLTHVETRAGLQINDYLSSNGLKVSREFATICGSLGKPISESNVQP